MYFPKGYHWEQNEKPSQYPKACLHTLSRSLSLSLSLSLSPPTPSYGNRSCLGTSNLNTQVYNPVLSFQVISIAVFPSIYPSFLFLESLAFILQNS